MMLEEIAHWHRGQAVQYRNAAEGQRWAADHNPDRRLRALRLSRNDDVQAIWHDKAADLIEAAITEVQGKPDLSDIPEADAAWFERASVTKGA